VSVIGYLFYAAKDSRSHDQQGLQYILDGLIETDDAFIGGSGGKRGRGTNKAKVVVSVSITEEGKPQFAQMDVVNDHSQASLLAYVQKAVV